MPFADEYVVSAHPPLQLHSKVPRPWALDTYSAVHVQCSLWFQLAWPSICFTWPECSVEGNQKSFTGELSVC